MKKLVLIAAIISFVGCSTLSKPCAEPCGPGEICVAGVCVPVVIPPTPNPTPTPSPTPTPTPTPMPTPTPTPAPATCALPAQTTFDAVLGGAPTLAPDVKAAILEVVAANPARFEVNPDGTYLLSAGGQRAKNEEPGAPEARQWFYDQVVAALASRGFCVAAFGTDQVVIAAPPFTGRVQAYHLINHGGGNVIFSPPKYEGDLVSTPPVPFGFVPCPKAVAKFRIHDKGPRPKGRILDATPVAGPNEDWCVSQGFLDPDGSGQSFCPLGPEEPAAQRLYCEKELGPYAWQIQPEGAAHPQICGSDGSPCDYNGGNQLQMVIQGQPNFKGLVRICAAKTGECSEISI